MYTIWPNNRIYKTSIKFDVVCIEWINNPALSEDKKALYSIEITALERVLNER